METGDGGGGGGAVGDRDRNGWICRAGIKTKERDHQSRQHGMGRWRDDGGILYDGVASPPLLMDARLRPRPPFLSVCPYKDLHPTSTYKFLLGKMVPFQKTDKTSFNWFGRNFSLATP